MMSDYRSIAAVTTSILAQGEAIDTLSRAVTVVGCVALFAGAYTGAPQPLAVMAGLVVLLGLVELYFSFRVRFDAALFAQLEQGLLDPEKLDYGLTQLKLIAGDKSGRPMELRAQGAVALLKRQVLAFCLQILAILALPMVALLW